MKSPITSLLILLAIAAPSLAGPPPAPAGYTWIKNEAFTDEFDGQSLDLNKWFDHHPTWKGRAPAKFIPEAVTVADGQLRIRNGTLPKPDGNFTLFGGAVISRSEQAFYGYYEVRMKASNISMSSTFWLSGGAAKIGDTKTTTEIDIVEAIGAPQRYPNWNKLMKSNTHYFVTTADGKKTDLAAPGQTAVVPSAGEAYHVYAAWWVDANTVHFYLDDKFAFTLHPKTDHSPTPFNRPMHVNMVTETYNWETPPTAEAVNNPAINTTYYDWVRAYTLVPVKPGK